MTDTAPARPQLARFVWVELPALPTLLLVALGSVGSALTGRWEVLGAVTILIAVFDVTLVGLVMFGAPLSRPLAERNLLFQSLAHFFRALKSAALLVAGGVLGAAIAIGLQPTPGTSRPTPDWLNTVTTPTLVLAAVIGAVGVVATLVRGFQDLSPRKRAKALRKGIRAAVGRHLASGIDLPDPGSTVVRHLTSNWYLIWLPSIMIAAAGAVIATILT